MIGSVWGKTLTWPHMRLDLAVNIWLEFLVIQVALLPHTQTFEQGCGKQPKCHRWSYSWQISWIWKVSKPSTPVCLIFEMVYFSYVHSMKSGISRQEIDKEKQSYLLNGSCFHWLSGMANISYGCLNHQLQASNHVQTLECVKAVTYPSWWTWSKIVVLNRRALGCCWSVMGVWQWSNVAQWCSKEETHSFGSN